MTVRKAAPLPECELCTQPTKRAVHEANGGLCTGCTRGIAETVRMLPVTRGGLVDFDGARRRQALLGRTRAAGDPTVFVELFTPPVPGTDPEVPDVEFGSLYTDGDQQ